MRIDSKPVFAIIKEDYQNPLKLTVFKGGVLHLEDSILKVTLVSDNGSGDLASLTAINCFVAIPPTSTMVKGETLKVYPVRNIFE